MTTTPTQTPCTGDAGTCLGLTDCEHDRVGDDDAPPTIELSETLWKIWIDSANS